MTHIKAIDNRASSGPETYKPDWIRPIDTVSGNVAQLIERYQFFLQSTQRNHSYDFFIEKTENTKTHRAPFSISTHIGEIWIKDFDLFFGALTGIPIEANEAHLIKKRFVLALASIPTEIKTLFGWITANFSSPMPENLTALRFRLHAPDCDIATLAYANNNVWNKLFTSEYLNRIEYQHADDVIIKRLLILGHSHLTRGDLKILRIGDLLRLDSCDFNSDGEGHIKLGDRLFKVSWAERGHEDIFQIISEVSTMNNSNNSKKLNNNDEDYYDDNTSADHLSPDDSSTDNLIDDEPNAPHHDSVPTLYLTETTHESNPIKMRSANDLPIKVDVHIGTFVMDEKQILKLRSKDLIRVDPNYRNRVSLQVNNAEIGVGEIISLDGDIAIQIVRLWGNS
jgi:flagellar motor switch/type III secretory pathway protein FliN